jgi:hypothetical protein
MDVGVVFTIPGQSTAGNLNACFSRRFQGGTVTHTEALKVIRATRRRAEKVRKLLRTLGDDEDTLPLAERFRRMTKVLQRAEADIARVELYGQLTLAFHELRLALN